MRKTIIAILLCTFVGCLTTWAQQAEPVRKMTVTLKNGEKAEFKTDEIEKILFNKDIQESSMITVEEIGQTSFKFSIKAGGKEYIYAVFETGNLDYFSLDMLFSTFKHFGSEDATYEWKDGVYYEFEELSVKPGRKYTIVAAIWPGPGVEPENIERVDIETLPEEQSQNMVKVTLSDITANSVKVKAEPDAETEQYIVFVKDKAWVDNVVSSYGEAVLQSTTERAVELGQAQLYYAASERVWEGLNPATDYKCIVVMQDKEGKKKMELHDFTTAAAK